MDRKSFLKAIALLSLAGVAMKLKDLKKWSDGLGATDQMPVLFVGHGSPMNAIEDNRFSREMKAIGKALPTPKAILMVSAHWETKGTFVTAQEKPPTIHDFGGFPQALYDAQYPAPGSKWLADETRAAVAKAQVSPDDQWGFDHGCWSVTIYMFPEANIPMIQLSLDYTKPASWHYELARELASLRKKGVLIIGSGNMVHNLRMVSLKSDDFNESYGYDWAIEANDTFKKLILAGDHQPLVNYSSLGRPAALSIPTPEHYLPMLYSLALQQEKESIEFFNDDIVGGAASMTSFVVS